MVGHPVRYTYREYLALDDASNVKLEFLAGQIYALAGGSPRHAALQAAVPALLFASLRAGPYRAHGAGLRVRVHETGLTTYPDVTILCGPRQLDPEDANTVVDASAIVEVLSPSTEATTEARSSRATGACRRSVTTCWSRRTSGASRCGRAAKATRGRAACMVRARAPTCSERASTSTRSTTRWSRPRSCSAIAARVGSGAS